MRIEKILEEDEIEVILKLYFTGGTLSPPKIRLVYFDTITKTTED